MSKVAFIFPGQGAQYIGMGKDFFEQFKPCREIFLKADEALKFNLSKIIFEGPEAELVRSENCQPATLVISIVCLAAFRAKFDLIPQFAAGLSLGEYTALVAAGCITFEDGVRLVRNRGRFMDEASRGNPGSMAAVIGMEETQVKEICREANCEIANLNCPGQVVISGSLGALEKAIELAGAKGAKRSIPLDVSGAFHSSLMKPAQDKLNSELAKVQIGVTAIKVVSNVTAREQLSAQEIRANLSQQLVFTTRWNDSIMFMAANGVNQAYEIGPGKVLKGLIRKINPDIRVNNIEKVADLDSI